MVCSLAEPVTNNIWSVQVHTHNLESKDPIKQAHHLHKTCFGGKTEHLKAGCVQVTAGLQREQVLCYQLLGQLYKKQQTSGAVSKVLFK